jgi:hypothetical protein
MNGLRAGSVRPPKGTRRCRGPRARSLSREGDLEQAFGRCRSADGAEHVYQGAQRDWHLPVAWIIEK